MRSAVRNLCLLHLIGNALLLGAGYYWLGTNESSFGTLAWSALVAVIIAAAALWLHGTACVSFGAAEPVRLRSAAMTALRNLPPLFLMGMVAIAVYLLLARWQTPKALFWIVRWLVLPVVFVPVFAAIAGRGWSGFRGKIWPRSWWHWIALLVFPLCAFWSPLKLVGWVPGVNGFGMEMTSFLVRAAAGYLLMTASLLRIEFIITRRAATPPGKVEQAVAGGAPS